VAGSAGFDSGCVASGSAEDLFASSGRGTDLATGVLWDVSGDWVEVNPDAGAVSAGATSSEGVRKPSFKVSASSGDETSKLQSVGDTSSFVVAGNSWLSEEDNWDSLAEDSVPEDRRPSTSLSVGAVGTGLRILDLFLLGRGGGTSELGPGELERCGGATKRRGSGSGSARLPLSFSPQPGTRSKPKDDATPQKPEPFPFLRGGTGGLSTFAPSMSRWGGGGSVCISSSQIFSRMVVRRKDQSEQVVRSRVRHHPDVQSGRAEGKAGDGSDSRNIYNWAGRDDVSWYGGGDGGSEEGSDSGDFLKIDDDQELN
jgi:hypothetical protein